MMIFSESGNLPAEVGCDASDSGGASGAARLPLNALWFPALDWAASDPPRCRRTIEGALAQRRGDGLIMLSAADVPGVASGGVAAWPVWGVVAARLRRTAPDAEWDRQVWRALRESLLAAVRVFDPERSGLPVWRAAAEAWDSREYRPNLATPDLPVLLLMEIDALLASQPPAEFSGADERLLDEREHLVSGLLDFLTDTDRYGFVARRVGGRRLPASARMAVFPLIWPGLPGNRVGPLLMHFSAAIECWRRSPRDIAALTEIRLWEAALRRCGAWNLLARIGGLERHLKVWAGHPEVSERQRAIVRAAAAPPVAEYSGERRGMRSFPRIFPGGGDGRQAVAAALIMLAAGALSRPGEARIDARALDLWAREARLAAVSGDTNGGREIRAALEAAGVFAPFIEMLALEQAEAAGDWREALRIYERWRLRDGDMPPVIFGMARAYEKLRQEDAAREYRRLFVERFGRDFPAAARVLRQACWDSAGRR